MGKVFAKFFVGAAAGLLAWMLCEPSAPRQVNGSWGAWENGFILALGALIGLAVGGLDGFTRGGKRHTGLGVALGLIFGAVGASCGHGLGGAISTAIFGGGVFSETNDNIIKVLPARIVAFVPIGACLGAAIGASSLTLKRTIQGAIGGALGAAVAGVAFDLLGAVLGTAILQSRGQTSGETGTPSRAIMAVLLGGAIGLFIGLVERYSRSAWVRLNLGRNEGKEWSIDGAQTFIGRSEGASVPLFGDPNIAPIHASIQKQGQNYVLIDGGSPMGTMVNGQRVQQALLGHGSQIQIGSFVLQFLLKNQAAPAVGPEAYRGQAYPVSGYPQDPMPRNPGPYSAPNPGGATQMMPGQQPMQGQPMPGYPTQVMPGQMPSQGMPMPGQPTQAFPSMGVAQPTIAYGGAMGSGFTLIALDGPLLGQRFPVNGPVEIGREGAGIRMPHDGNASRRHATISPGMGGVAVQDLSSTNGTFVNGQRVSQANAGPGDMIKVGSTTFRVEPS